MFKESMKLHKIEFSYLLWKDTFLMITSPMKPSETTFDLLNTCLLIITAFITYYYFVIFQFLYKFID